MSDQRIDLTQLRANQEYLKRYGGVIEDYCLEPDEALALIDIAEAARAVSESGWFQIRSEGEAFVLREALDRYTTEDAS